MRHLEEILKRMKKLTAEEFDQVFECDNEFHEELVKMCGMPRVQAWKEQFTTVIFSPDMIWCRTKKLSQNGSMHRIRSFMMHVWQEDCEEICKAIKGHYWRTIGEMMREQNVDAPDLERGWESAF